MNEFYNLVGVAVQLIGVAINLVGVAVELPPQRFNQSAIINP
jgi:hypothetical protein